VFSYVMYSTRSDIVSELVSADGPPAQPYIPALRTLTGLRIALEELVPGAMVSDHVLIAVLPKVVDPRYDLVHIIMSRNPFTPAERNRFVQTSKQLGFVTLHPSGEGEVNQSNLYTQIVSTKDLSALAAQVPFSIWPATDDRPFQYALDVGHMWHAFKRGELMPLLSGNPLVSMGLSIGLFAALLTLTPILLSTRRTENLRMFRASWSMLLYFACIGFAYMGVEIAALLRLQSFLGKPIYGLSVGLFAFLLASGLGSNFTNRLEDARLERSVRTIIVSLVLVGLFFVAGSASLFSHTIAYPLPARIAVAVASIFPLAFPMGMLFPIGVRLIARDCEDLIPWAWATNGCFSVLGIFSTRITALLFGFSRALIMGLVAYLLVIVCTRLYIRRQIRASAPY